MSNPHSQQKSPLTNSFNLAKSVSVNKSLGIEVKETSGIFHNSVQHKFISSEQVIDVVINEGAYGLQFIYYLAIIAKDLDRLVLIFPVSLVLSEFSGRCFTNFRKGNRFKISTLGKTTSGN